MSKFVPKPKKIYRVLMNGSLYNKTASITTARNDVVRGLKTHPNSSFKIQKTKRT